MFYETGVYTFRFYETGVCWSRHFFLETSELQNLINPSILSKKTAVLLKGEILRKFRCILLQNLQIFISV